MFCLQHGQTEPVGMLALPVPRFGDILLENKNFPLFAAQPGKPDLFIKYGSVFRRPEAVGNDVLPVGLQRVEQDGNIGLLKQQFAVLRQKV